MYVVRSWGGSVLGCVSRAHWWGVGSHLVEFFFHDTMIVMIFLAPMDMV